MFNSVNFFNTRIFSLFNCTEVLFDGRMFLNPCCSTHLFYFLLVYTWSIFCSYTPVMLLPTCHCSCILVAPYALTRLLLVMPLLTCCSLCFDSPVARYAFTHLQGSCGSLESLKWTCQFLSKACRSYTPVVPYKCFYSPVTIPTYRSFCSYT